MGYVILPCAVGRVKLLLRKLAGSNELRHPGILALGVSLVLILEPADHSAIRCHISMKAEITDAVLKREQLRLTVKIQFQRPKIFGNHG